MVWIILTVIVAGLINPYLKLIFVVQSFLTLSIGGMANGYLSAKMMRYFGAKKWRYAAIAASFILPVCLFIIFSIVDIIEWIESSSNYQPFTFVIAFALIWIIFTVPITYIGIYYGFTSNTVSPPCKVNAFRRQIPTQPLYRNVYI